MDFDAIIRHLEETENAGVIKKPACENCAPDRKAVVEILKDLQSLLFPGYYKSDAVKLGGLSQRMLLEKISRELCQELEKLRFLYEIKFDIDQTVDAFLSRLPAIKALLLKDIEALYEGDPAAKSHEEVLLCYPGFYAISIYRLAHELHLLKVPLIPRAMTEYAHEKTGIDIHAGATIGEYFFIDHGTGIVIGETTVIGDHVKLYQGVTLGAKSFEVDENGNPIKDLKRHPNIGSHVVIYANATILGGETTIGDHCVIGGSVWLTHSVPSGKTVYYMPKG